MPNTMERIFDKMVALIYGLTATGLIIIALMIIILSGYEILTSLTFDQNMMKKLLHSIGALVISVAIIDVAKYMFEEEIFRSKELRSPEEARKTLTKIFVIISIAVCLEGLVYIFKAGEEDLSLLLYPAALILTAVVAMVGLGLYQKLSVRTEREVTENIGS